MVDAVLSLDVKSQFGGYEYGEKIVEARGDGPNIELEPEYQRLWSSLSFDPKPMDHLIEQTGLTANAVSSMLLMLELKGVVEVHQGGTFSRK